MDHPKDHFLFGLGLPGYIYIYIYIYSYADCFYHTKISFDSSPQHLLFLLQEADVARSPKPSAKVSL